MPQGVNQIPASCTICGDMRLTPFYSAEKAANSLKSYVDKLNKDITQLPTRGPVSYANFALLQKMLVLATFSCLRSHISSCSGIPP